MFRYPSFPILVIAPLLISTAIGIAVTAWVYSSRSLPIPPGLWFAWIVLLLTTGFGIKQAHHLHRKLRQPSPNQQPPSETPPPPSPEPQLPDVSPNLLLALEQTLNTTPDFPSALHLILEQICQLTGWTYAEAWIPTADKSALQCSSIWYQNTQSLSPDHRVALQDFRHYTEGLILLPDEDIPGRVWHSNQPQWFGNLAQDNDIFSRGTLAHKVGLGAAFGLPIPIPAQETLTPNLIPRRSATLGILVFFTHYSSFQNPYWVKQLSDRALDFGRILHQKQVTTEFKTLFSAITDVILVFDAQGYILNIAPTTPQPLYQMPSHLIGKSVQDIFEPDQSTTFINWIWQSLNTQTTLQTEYQLTIEDQILWFSATIAPITDVSGMGDSVIWIARDITERKQVMEALSGAKEAAEKANQAKSHFLAKMSHELRTPLNAILGFTQVMIRHLSANQHSLSATQIEEHFGYLKVIHNSGEHLLDLINDLLNWSKIEAGKMELHQSRFNLYDMLSTLYQMFKLKAEHQGLTLSFEVDTHVPPFIEGDSGKIRQVLINLLGNALKFTPEGGITVGIHWREDRSLEEAFLICEVQDTGIGIAASELAHLFEPFVQSSSDRGFQEGTGLGLPISQQVVELMGGQLTVESEVGQGSRFQFTLPVKRETRETSSDPIEYEIPANLRPHTAPLPTAQEKVEDEDLSYVQASDWEKLQQATLAADEELLLKLIETIFTPNSQMRGCLTEWVYDFQFDRVDQLIREQLSQKAN
ncbi:sensor histidine kinase [Roseofilum capinflatum]|uniref:histidine kinase n=1 Tax=Roseofilum capinflatum BLCC-M114 TaxID=3022440 RepID=A0ABT7B4V8_9CYAN|nr:PAS domain-containing sensor histidine kinase [Roseofilum capinflatum]MDJ1174213.1 ATP-binding protein [Roseofilum capinflatum BLCC-M114]